MSSSSNNTGGELFLQILRNFGVEYIFASSGTEWAPLWEALARQKAEGIDGPEYLCSRHEDIAIGMACGYARATGKLAVCLVHCSVGSLRIGMGLRGAYQAQLPMLVCAGESLSFGEGAPWVGFHWGVYLKDYGGPARLMEPLVKSSYCVNTPAMLAGSVHRAIQLATASTPGPVFLSIPFEISAGPAKSEVIEINRHPSLSQVDESGLREAAELLKNSKNPLIITEKLGRNPAAVDDLTAIAECLGAVVVEAQHPEYVNFPRDHDLHGGYQANPYLAGADVVLVVDMLRSPWYPETALNPKHAEVIAIGDDPLGSRVPFYGFAADLTLCGRADDAMARLRELLPQATPGSKERRLGWAGKNNRSREDWNRMAEDQKSHTPIDARWLCKVLNESLPTDAVLVDETIITNFTMNHVMDRLKPGQYINALDGGLGTGLGAALGVKTAGPDKQVIAIMGDGAFNYNAPLAALGFCQEYNMPITIIVVDNGQYLAMRMAAEQLYPDGWSKSSNNYYGAFVSPQINYADMAGLVGGYGEQVSEPEQVEPAFQRALAANREGRVAILNIIIDDELLYLGPMMTKGGPD